MHVSKRSSEALRRNFCPRIEPRHQRSPLEQHGPRTSIRSIIVTPSPRSASTSAKTKIGCGTSQRNGNPERRLGVYGVREGGTQAFTDLRIENPINSSGSTMSQLSNANPAANDEWILRYLWGAPRRTNALEFLGFRSRRGLHFPSPEGLGVTATPAGAQEQSAIIRDHHCRRRDPGFMRSPWPVGREAIITPRSAAKASMATFWVP